MALALALALPAPRAAAGTITREFEYPASGLRISGSRAGLRIDLRGAVHAAAPGQLDLPAAVAAIEIPAGERVLSWQVFPVEIVDLDARGRVARVPAAVRSDGRRLEARESVSETAAEWTPARPEGRLQQGSLQGHVIATFRLIPVQSFPADGRLRLTRRFRVELTTGPAEGAPLTRVRRTDLTEAMARRALGALHLEYAARPNVRTGRGGAFLAASGEYPAPFDREYPYIIVTEDSLVASFRPLADWKTREGYPAHIEPLSSIAARYPQGVDLAEKIRMYIRDSYLYSGCVWALLGGDASIIPVRFAHSILNGGENIPADSYFGNLDGNWNANGNSVFGEAYMGGSVPGDSVDFYPDVAVGRAPCANKSQVASFIAKTLSYDQSPPAGDFLNDNLLMAEVLFPVEYDSATGIIEDGTLVSEDVQDSMPDYNHTVKLYENNNQFQFPGSLKETLPVVLDSLNAGYNLALHVGHGFRNSMSVGQGVLVNAHMRGLTNGPRNSFLVSMDCTSGAIDYDCIGAAAVNNPAGGAFAFLGCSREDYPFVSRSLMDSYFHAVNFDSVSALGEASMLTRLDWTAYTEDDNPYRWGVLALILLGDPGLQFRTRPGQPLDVASPASFSMGDPGYTLAVTSAGAPVESAYVCVYKPGDDLRAGYTDALGQVTLPFQPDSAGPFFITATRRNWLPFQGGGTVVPRTAAYLYDYTTSKPIQDGSASPQDGNGDGAVDAGETVQFGITLGNSGGSPATAVSCSLSTATAGVTVLGDSAGFGAIAPGASAPAGSPFTVNFSRGLRDGQKVPFYVHLSDDEGDTRDDYFTLGVRAPLAEHLGTAWTDSVVGPLHVTVLKVNVRNNGSGKFRGLKGLVLPVVPGLVPLDSTSGYGSLGPGASWTGDREFRFLGQASPQSRFYLYLADAYGHVDSMDFDLQAPSYPQHLSALGSQSSNTLSWTAPADSPTVRGYYVYRSLSASGPFTRINSRVTAAMCYFRDAGLAPLTPYSYYVTAVDSGGNEGAPSGTVTSSTNPPYHLGFPIETTHEMPGSPVLVNFDHSPDGSLEVVQASDGIYIWHPDGAELKDGDNQNQTSGVWVKRGTYYPNSVCVANLFQNGHFTVLACSQDSLKVFAWDEDGNMLPGWPQKVLVGFPFGSIAVGDIDGDGIPEIVMGCSSQIYAWHRDGTEVRDGDGNPSTNGVFATVGGSFIYGCPALADLNGDGKKEIIIGGGDGKLYAFKSDGTQVKGFPYVTSGPITGSAAVADIDLDGHKDIIFPSANSKLYVINDTAAVRPGWPVSMSLGNTSRSPSPAIADMDGDGYPDIVEATTNGFIKVLDRNGVSLPGWANVRYAAAYAVIAGTSESSPIVADIDGDGQLEVLQGAEDATLYGFNHDGTTLAGFPIRVGGEIRGTPAAWDLTNTGKINIVLPCWDKNVYIWDYPGTFHANLFPWPMFRHDDQHTGQYVGQNVITAVGEVALDAEAGAEGIRVRWSAPEGIAGRVSWNVYRREGGGTGAGVVPAGELNTIPADFARVNAEAIGAAAQEYLDADVRGGQSYAYILEMQVDGRRTRLLGPLVRTLPAQFLPVRWALGQNVPNPFRGRTVLRYAVPAGVKGSELAPKAVRITVHDVTGREVRVLAEGLKAPGSYSAAWDGRDGSGRELGSGVYFYRLVAAGETLTRKIILVH